MGRARRVRPRATGKNRPVRYHEGRFFRTSRRTPCKQTSLHFRNSTLATWWRSSTSRSFSLFAYGRKSSGGAHDAIRRNARTDLCIVEQIWHGCVVAPHDRARLLGRSRPPNGELKSSDAGMSLMSAVLCATTYPEKLLGIPCRSLCPVVQPGEGPKKRSGSDSNELLTCFRLLFLRSSGWPTSTSDIPRSR